MAKELLSDFWSATANCWTIACVVVFSTEKDHHAPSSDRHTHTHPPTHTHTFPTACFLESFVDLSQKRRFEGLEVVGGLHASTKIERPRPICPYSKQILRSFWRSCKRRSVSPENFRLMNVQVLGSSCLSLSDAALQYGRRSYMGSIMKVHI